MVDIGKLMFIGGLVTSPQRGRAAICHGRVRIEEWTIGLPETTLPRWALRGVTIHHADRSMRISDDGSRVLRVRDGSQLA